MQKVCPACGSTVLWPYNVTEIDCWKCDTHLSVARPFKPPSKVGQQIMVAGLVVIALGFVLALVSALAG